MKNWINALMTGIVLAMLVGFAWAVTSPETGWKPAAPQGSATEISPDASPDEGGPYNNYYLEEDDTDEDNAYGFL